MLLLKTNGNGRTNQISRNFDPFLRIETTKQNGKDIHEILVRVTSRCNQKCDFCSADRIGCEPDGNNIKRSIEAAARPLKHSFVTLTGGEPTVRKDIADLIKHTLQLKQVESVQVQTNAVIIGLRPEQFKFPKSKRLSFFISLHGLTSPVYDRCTQSRGQLPFAVKGIQELQKRGYRLTVNCVINKMNADHLQDFILLFKKMFCDDSREQCIPELHFSIMMCPEFREKAADMLVPYSILSRKLEETYRLALDCGIPVASPLSSTHASIPPCMLNKELRKREIFPEIHEHETGYEDFSRRWVKAEKCRQCREVKYCLGLPKPYAMRFGFSEVNPITL